MISGCAVSLYSISNGLLNVAVNDSALMTSLYPLNVFAFSLEKSPQKTSVCFIGISYNRQTQNEVYL